MWFLFYGVVLLHLFVVAVNVMAFFLLPFSWLILDVPFWYTLFLITPIESLILTLSFSRDPCPLTRLENAIRRELGLREIGGFISYYLVKRRWMAPARQQLNQSA